jgi:hypothetical protein
MQPLMANCNVLSNAATTVMASNTIMDLINIILMFLTWTFASKTWGGGGVGGLMSLGVQVFLSLALTRFDCVNANLLSTIISQI